MRLPWFSLLAALALASCGGDDDNSPPAPGPVASAWEIGPVINGKNYSKGSVDGDTITVQDVHYVTRKAVPPLAGRVALSFHLSAPLTGTGCGDQPATATLYFQKAGDDWETDGDRWWATVATARLDHAGDYTLTASLDGRWTSVHTKTAESHPADFASAKSKASRIGFTIGNCTGFGHGGTGPAVLTITGFSVQ